MNKRKGCQTTNQEQRQINCSALTNFLKEEDYAEIIYIANDHRFQ